MLALAPCRAPVCRMNLFPTAGDTAPPAGASPQSRNADMATLLGNLIEAADDPVVAKAMLKEQTAFLLQPFIGIPEPGSIYGSAESTLAEKAAAYKAGMEQRVAKCRKAPSGERQAAALELLAAHVLEEVRRLELNGGAESDEHDDDDEPDIRLICCDVDGTLLTPEHTVTQRTIDTILKVMSIDDDLTFCTCTGRGRFGAYNALGPIGEELRARNAPGVFLNGLLVYGPDGEVVQEEVLPPAVVEEVAGFVEESGLSLVAFSGERILCSQSDDWTDVFTTIKEPTPIALGVPWEQIARDERANKLILLGEPERLAGLRPSLAERLGASASLTCAIPTMLEVLPAGGSKGKGVRALLDRLGVAPEEVMAIGDAENDIGMLELAGLSVAMGNAPEDVRSVADHVSESNTEDGAAAALERFLEIGD